MQNKQNLIDVFNQFTTHVSSQFDLPEALQEQFTVKEYSVGDKLKAEIKFLSIPRGQMASFITELEVTIHATREVDKLTGRVTYLGNINYRYAHPSGGTNGHGTSYVLSVREREGKMAQLLDFMEEGAYDHLHQEALREIKAHRDTATEAKEALDAQEGEQSGE